MSDEAAARYRKAIAGLQLLTRLTPRSVDLDRVLLLEYATTGRRPDLVWSVDPDPDGRAALLRAEAILLTGSAGGFSEELTNLADGLDAPARGPRTFRAWADARYGREDSALVSEAQLVLAREQRLPESARTTSAEAFAARCADAMTAYRMEGWTAEVRSGLGARVMTSASAVVVRAGEVFSERETTRLIVHEVGSHALRRANADSQPLACVRFCPFGDAWTEEGIAVWHEKTLGVAEPMSDRVYAARVVAVAAARTSGVLGVVDALLELLPARQAVDIAIRAKRGHLDPHAPGAFSKDLAYLGGYLDVAQHLEAQPDDHQLLMAAKWPLRRLEELRTEWSVGHVLLPGRLPDERLLGTEASSRRPFRPSTGGPT